jgi:transposase
LFDIQTGYSPLPENPEWIYQHFLGFLDIPDYGFYTGNDELRAAGTKACRTGLRWRAMMAEEMMKLDVAEESNEALELVIANDPRAEQKLLRRDAPALRERFIQLRAEGMSYNKIAKELDISRSTLIRWFHDLKYQIHWTRVLALDSLAKQYVMGKEHRIRFLGEQYKRLIEELASRQDYSDIPTPKLLDMVLLLNEKIEKETEIAFITLDDGLVHRTKPDWVETP